jgi:hypothetical protein
VAFILSLILQIRPVVRLVFAGVFCLLLLACSEPQPPPPEIEAQASEPLLTLAELLSADDVKLALAQASKSDDQQALALWQDRLLEAGEQVSLGDEELNLLRGEQGRVYLSFQGMKTNYQQEFEQAFFEFGDVDAVYQRYPAFQSLHERSKELVQKRDALIQSIVTSLVAEGVDQEQALQQARQQWQSMMQPLQADVTGSV